MNPFIKLYKTVNGYYFFDVNKNDIIEIEQDTYNILFKKDDENTNEEIEMLKKEGYLSPNRAKEVKGLEADLAENILKRHMEQLILQLTQRCNLRCTYCTYTANAEEKQGRGHSEKDMSWEVAKKAIDFYAHNSIDTLNPFISFYGGEPLLKFELLKKCVIYCERIFTEKNIRFSITTNGTLLNDEVIDFFVKHDVELTISIDGLKTTHDMHRRFANNGRGSFDVIKSNVIKIKENWPDYYKKCTINMVIDPQNEFDEINDFFDPEKNELFDIEVSTGEIEDLFLSNKNIYDPTYLFKKSYHRFLAYLKMFGIINVKRISPIVEEELKRVIHYSKKITTLKPLGKQITVGGTCIPGQKRCFCNYKGKFYPCEKVNEADKEMIIGNVDTGFDYDHIRRLFMYMKRNEEYCTKCWACRNCYLCIRCTSGDAYYDRKENSSFCISAQKDFDIRLKNSIFIYELQQYYKMEGGLCNVL